MLYLMRKKKFGKGGSFEIDFCHKEVTDIESESVLRTFKLI